MIKKHLLITVAHMTAMFTIIGSRISCGQSENKSDQITPQSYERNLTVDFGGSVTMQFVLIPAGLFTMGSDKGLSTENPFHKVTISKPFYLGKYTVTQEQWQQIMGYNPSRSKGAKKPVEQVSWNDCHKFLTKLNEKIMGRHFRLPTEAEWEYACRAGSNGDYNYESGRLDENAWYISNAGFRSHPVGEKKPNAWGLYDMHGNVWEWCQDVYHKTYEGAPTDGSARTQGGESDRVLRGGSWGDSAPSLRSASRIANYPDGRQDVFGLRVAMDVGTP